MADCFFAFLLFIYEMIHEFWTGGKQRFVKEPAQMKAGYAEVIAMPGFLDCRLSSTGLVTRSHTPLLGGGKATFKPNTLRQVKLEVDAFQLVT